MKTPREILLSHHSDAVQRLDAVRRDVVAGLNREDTEPRRLENIFVSWCLGGSKKLWQELFLPSRRIWTSLATIWILILAVNFAERDPAPAGKVFAAPRMMSVVEQQRLLNELFADRSPAADADREKTFSPKPRTGIFQSQTA